MSDTEFSSCACCGERRALPLRRDDMGGYVCLTCADRKLTSQAEELSRLREGLNLMRATLVYGMERSTRDWRKPEKQEAAHDMAEQLLSVFDVTFPALNGDQP